MFITNEDYTVVVGQEALNVLSRASVENRENAELEAIEEISGYLRPLYDCNAIFSAVGDARNRLVVMRAVDIALYHLTAALPQKMGTEIRKERYERAIRWLEDVKSGDITPGLPLVEESAASSSSFGTSYNSEPRLRHNW